MFAPIGTKPCQPAWEHSVAGQDASGIVQSNSKRRDSTTRLHRTRRAWRWRAPAPQSRPSGWWAGWSESPRRRGAGRRTFHGTGAASWNGNSAAISCMVFHSPTGGSSYLMTLPASECSRAGLPSGAAITSLTLPKDIGCFCPPGSHRQPFQPACQSVGRLPARSAARCQMM